MATVPNQLTAGQLVTNVDMKTYFDAIVELQASGILLDLTSTADAVTTSAAVTPAGFAGSIVLTGSRRIQMFMQGLTNASASGLLIVVSCTIGGASVRAQNFHQATGGPGQIDINRSGVAATLTAGTYSLSASLTAIAGIGTATLLSGARLQVMDIGAA